MKISKLSIEKDIEKNVSKELKEIRSQILNDKDQPKWVAPLFRSGLLDRKSSTFSADVDIVVITIWELYRKPKILFEGSKPRTIVLERDYSKEPKIVLGAIEDDIGKIIMYSIRVDPEDAELWIDGELQPNPGKGKSYRKATTKEKIHIEVKRGGYKNHSEDWNPQKGPSPKEIKLEK